MPKIGEKSHGVNGAERKYLIVYADPPWPERQVQGWDVWGDEVNSNIKLEDVK